MCGDCGGFDNVLYCDDKLDVLRRHIRDETLDLVCLHPPFGRKATWNVLFGEQDRSKAAARFASRWLSRWAALRQLAALPQSGSSAACRRRWLLHTAARPRSGVVPWRLRRFGVAGCLHGPDALRTESSA